MFFVYIIMKGWIEITSQEEHLIIVRILSGYHNDYEILVRRYQGAIFNLMLRMTDSKDTAADLAQETFVRGFENLSRFNQEKLFFPWLYTIGLNIARDHCRKNSRENANTSSINLIGQDQLSSPGSDVQARKNLRGDFINQAMDQLPWESREALIMRFREEFTYQEIAEVLNITLSSAKMKVHRGLKKIRAIFGEEEKYL
ncbi:MAG: RNA polymerase sigma factor [Desulfonatronovibrio sp.]